MSPRNIATRARTLAPTVAPRSPTVANEHWRQQIKKRYTGANARPTGANDSKSGAMLAAERRTTHLEPCAPPVCKPRGVVRDVCLITSQTQAASRKLEYLHASAGGALGDARRGGVKLVTGLSGLRVLRRACLQRRRYFLRHRRIRLGFTVGARRRGAATRFGAGPEIFRRIDGRGPRTKRRAEVHVERLLSGGQRTSSELRVARNIQLRSRLSKAWRRPAN